MPATGSFHPTFRTVTLKHVTQIGPDDDSAHNSMPGWVIRAIVVFWVGYLGTFVVRDLFNRLSGFLVLVLISLFLAIAIEPAADRLARRGMRRGAATGLVLAAVLVIAGAFAGIMGALVADQANDLVNNRDTYITEVSGFINDTFGTDIDAPAIIESLDDPDGPVQTFFNSQRSNAVRLSVSAFGSLLQVFSILLFTFYLAADGPRLRRTICSWLTPRRQRIVLRTWDLAVKKTGGYLYSRAILAVVSAVVHWIAFELIGTPAPIPLAIWVGVVSQFVPVVGAFIAGVLPALLTVVDSPLRAGIVVAVIAVYQQVENFLVAPRVTAHTLDIHPAIAFGAVIAGAALLGPLGAVLGLPVAAMVQGIIGSIGTRYDVVDGVGGAGDPAGGPH